MPRLSVRTNDEDEKNIVEGMKKYPHMDRSEYIRWLAAQEVNRQNEGSSKDAKLDYLIEQNECLYRLLVMLLHERGMKPVESQKSIPVGEIPGCQRRDK